jgi:hypothetical protein
MSEPMLIDHQFAALSRILEQKNDDMTRGFLISLIKQWYRQGRNDMKEELRTLLDEDDCLML